MPSKGSPLANFLLDALIDNKYPDILFWVSKTEGIFCLQCVCKYQKKWSKDEARIFEDYHRLKPRKSDDKRQRLLLALKTSPCIETLEDLSSKEKKFYRFLKKTGNSSLVTDSEMISCKNEVAEISAESPFSTGVDVQSSELKHDIGETSCFTNVGMHVSWNEVIDMVGENSRSADAVVTDSEMISCKCEVIAKSPFSTNVNVLSSEVSCEAVETSCFTSVGMHVSCNEVKNEVTAGSSRITDTGINILSSELGDEVFGITAENPSSIDTETSNMDCVNSTSNESGIIGTEGLLTNIWDNISSILNAENWDFTVPDERVDISETFDADTSQSMFNGFYDANFSSVSSESYDADSSSVSSGCYDTNNTFNNNSYADFSDLSVMIDQNCPEDYDPTMDLLQSLGNNKSSDQPKSLNEIHNLCSESSQYEVKGVYSVDSNDFVKLFEETSSDHMNHNYYMMILKTSKS